MPNNRFIMRITVKKDGDGYLAKIIGNEKATLNR